MKVIISELQKHKLLELDIHIFDDLLFENDIEETWSKKYKKSINCNNFYIHAKKNKCKQLCRHSLLTFLKSNNDDILPWYL